MIISISRLYIGYGFISFNSGFIRFNEVPSFLQISLSNIFIFSMRPRCPHNNWLYRRQLDCLSDTNLCYVVILRFFTFSCCINIFAVPFSKNYKAISNFLKIPIYNRFLVTLVIEVSLHYYICRIRCVPFPIIICINQNRNHNLLFYGFIIWCINDTPGIPFAGGFDFRDFSAAQQFRNLYRIIFQRNLRIPIRYPITEQIF